MLKCKCTVYCLSEECTHYNKGATIFGTCRHPVHQNLWPINDRTQLLLETCPLKNPPQHPGYIPKERFVTAMPGYIFSAKGATGPSIYKLVRQMLSVKRYRPISHDAMILRTDGPWREVSIESKESI